MRKRLRLFLRRLWRRVVVWLLRSARGDLQRVPGKPGWLQCDAFLVAFVDGEWHNVRGDS